MAQVGKCFKWGLLFVTLVVPLLSGAQRIADSLDRPAQQTPRAPRSVLLDVTLAGNRLVAVGERGIVILSDDGGQSWRQGRVPVSESLTAVAFPSPMVGFAVGGSGVVIRTEDGGESWTRVLDGSTAASVAMRDAQDYAKRYPNREAAKQVLAQAQRLVADGPDKPFLTVHFDNEQAGLVAGAYGLLFRTEDGGKTWMSWMDRLDNPKGLHINAMKVVGSNIYLAGEQGLFFRSTDKGLSFARVATSYKGSYFSMVVTSSGDIVLAGMRGNVYRSSDLGKTFNKVDIPAPASIRVATALADGTLVFVNEAGQVLVSRDQGRTIQAVAGIALPTAAAVLQEKRGMLSVGLAGVVPFSIEGPRAGSSGGAQ
jgi:photosystem II stability/assembly factor-like uncharacterized protein